SALWAPRAQFWFLYALFLIFILLAIVFAYAPRRGALPLLLAAAALYVFQNDLPTGFVVAYIASGLVFFVLGFVFETYVRDEAFFNPRMLALLLIGAVVGQFLFHGFFQHLYTHRGIGSLIVAVLSLLLVVNLSYFLSQRPTGVLLLIGSSSMAIFLMHV